MKSRALIKLEENSFALASELGQYERLIKEGKDLQARAYLPKIQYLCSLLSVDWQVMTGVKDGYLFKTQNTSTLSESFGKVSEEKQEVTNFLPKIPKKSTHCPCGSSLEGKKATAVYCSPACKYEFGQKLRR